MAVMNVSQAQRELDACVETARREAVLLQRDGRNVAVLISAERYDELMDALEELEDLQAVETARASGELDAPGVPWAEVKAELDRRGESTTGGSG